MSTAQVLELAEAKRVAQLFAVEQIKRVLPYLVPLPDAEFVPGMVWGRWPVNDRRCHLSRSHSGCGKQLLSDISDDRFGLGQTAVLGGQSARSKIQPARGSVIRMAVS